MKRLPKFQDINESAESVNESWRVDVIGDLSNEKEEIAEIRGFKVVLEPVTVVNTTGIISEDKTDLTIDFSNGDRLIYKVGFGGYGKATLHKSDESYDVSDRLPKYVGSTGTVTGDLLIMYRDDFLSK